MTSTDVNNNQDILDSMDIIARIEEVKELLPQSAHEVLPGDASEIEELREELQMLEDLAEEASGSPDWEHGETLIRDTYFREYAQELAENYGMVTDDATWPNNCIDWDQAAHQLSFDYMLVSFGDADYYIRS